MSYTTLYSIDTDGELHAREELHNSHGGQPLIWNALEDKFDPPTEEWKWSNRFFADEQGNFHARWMFDLGPKRDGKDGSLSRSFKAIARTYLPADERIAFAATDHRTWISAGHCERVAVALESVAKLGHPNNVNHLPEIAAFLRRAVPEGWMGVRIHWSSLNQDIARHYDEEAEDTISANFADREKLAEEFEIFELFSMPALADLRPGEGAA